MTLGFANGISVNPYDFQVYDDFDPTVVAKSLSHICRYTGHYGFMSVAEHSVIVATIMKNRYINFPNGPNNTGGNSVDCAKWMLLGLLHDSMESVFGDISSPVKSHPSLWFLREKEDFYLEQVFELHGLNPDRYMRSELHRADKYAMSVELGALGQSGNPAWKEHFRNFPCNWFQNQPVNGDKLKAKLWTSAEAEIEWLNSYKTNYEYLVINYGKEKTGQEFQNQKNPG